MDEKLGSHKQFCVFQTKEKSGNIGLFIPNGFVCVSLLRDSRIILIVFTATETKFFVLEKIAEIEKRKENYCPRTPCEPCR